MSEQLYVLRGDRHLPVRDAAVAIANGEYLYEKRGPYKRMGRAMRRPRYFMTEESCLRKLADDLRKSECVQHQLFKTELQS